MWQLAGLLANLLLFYATPAMPADDITPTPSAAAPHEDVQPRALKPPRDPARPDTLEERLGRRYIPMTVRMEPDLRYFHQGWIQTSGTSTLQVTHQYLNGNGYYIAVMEVDIPLPGSYKAIGEYVAIGPGGTQNPTYPAWPELWVFKANPGNSHPSQPTKRWPCVSQGPAAFSTSVALVPCRHTFKWRQRSPIHVVAFTVTNQ